jgi:uncharacterized protein YecE (DUF72 family)
VFHLGTQSWTYLPEWVGVFYPPRTSQSDALSFYSSVFDTVEVNATFHALPAESTVRGWVERTPPGFLMALKFPREVTHDARLALPESKAPTRELLRLAAMLGDRCGPLLVQLPPSFGRTLDNREALARFLELVPEQGVKLVVELRHPSWADAAVERALAERNVAWCLVDGDQPNHRSVLFTADFTYIRWNRSGLPFESYDRLQYDRSADLDWWAALLTSLPEGVRTVFGYMSNEFAGHAPASLRMLCERLGLPSVDPKSLWPQPALF